MVKDVSFELHKGEISDFSGLMGAGTYRNCPRNYLEQIRLTVVTFISMVKVDIKSPQDAVRNGIDIFQKIERDTELLFRICCRKHFNGYYGTVYEGIFINKKKEKEVGSAVRGRCTGYKKHQT